MSKFADNKNLEADTAKSGRRRLKWCYTLNLSSIEK
jgi:hypothetical protein